jgi:hypothetical protein
LGGGAATPCASPPPRPSIFPIILFLSPTLFTAMTSISLHMRWPLTSQLHGSVLKENHCFFRYGAAKSTEAPEEVPVKGYVHIYKIKPVKM